MLHQLLRPGEHAPAKGGVALAATSSLCLDCKSHSCGGLDLKTRVEKNSLDS